MTDTFRDLIIRTSKDKEEAEFRIALHEALAEFAFDKNEEGKMVDDLVKRLREVGGISDDGATQWYINPDGPEAAERIEKLEEALNCNLPDYDPKIGIVERLRQLGNWKVDGTKSSPIYNKSADHIEKLEAALRNVTTTWDVWQKEKDSNSFTELFASICEAKALEGKDDESFR